VLEMYQRGVRMGTMRDRIVWMECVDDDTMYVEIARLKGRGYSGYSTNGYYVNRGSIAWRCLPAILDKYRFKTYRNGKIMYHL